MRRILSVLLENESGALSRVIGLFSQRGYNIESLTVAPTDDPTLSRMTIQTVGDEKVLEQIEKQLHKLVDVLRVSELACKTETGSLNRSSYPFAGRFAAKVNSPPTANAINAHPNIVNIHFFMMPPEPRHLLRAVCPRR